MQTDRVIEGRAALTKKDYKVLAYFNVFQRHPAEPYLAGLLVLLVLSILAGYFLPWFHPDEPLVRMGYIFWLILLAVLAGTECMTIQYMKKGENQTIGKEICYRLTSSHLQMKDGEDVVSIEWRGFFKAIELRHHFLLFLTINHALILPKRAFSQEDRLEISRLLQDRLGENFILRSQNV